jgi:hypothetical protein
MGSYETTEGVIAEDQDVNISLGPRLCSLKVSVIRQRLCFSAGLIYCVNSQLNQWEIQVKPFVGGGEKPEG